jgi:hypothetical protein
LSLIFVFFAPQKKKANHWKIKVLRKSDVIAVEAS